MRHSHILFASGFIEGALNVIKPFLSKKVMSRVSKILKTNSISTGPGKLGIDNEKL